MGYVAVLVEDRGPIRIVWLALPEKRNVLDLVMREELRRILEHTAGSEEVKALVMAGQGGNFSAGGDLRSMEGLTPSKGRRRVQRVGGLISTMRRMAQPIIAAVDGAAVGAGLGLALACDLVVASERARFGVGQIKVGLIPDMGLTRYLPLRIGWTRAVEMMMRGILVDATTALQWGLVNRVVSPEVLMQEALSMASELAQGPSVAISMVKEAMDRFPSCLEDSLGWEANSQALAFMTEDFDEGRKAFLQKRGPRFKGS